MPTPITHAAVGYAIAAWTQPDAPTRRVCLIAAACAALPDVDVITPFAHRGITHSLAFALVATLVTTVLFFRGNQWSAARGRIAAMLGLALLSHSCLDALSTYSYGVEFFAPFSLQRYRFAWTPLGDPSGSLVGQLMQEATFLLAPAVLVAWLGLRLRGRAA